MTEDYTLTIEQGSTLKVWWALELLNGSVADLPAIGTGYTVGRLTVRDRYGGAELLSLTTANGGIVLGLMTDTDGAQWSGYLYASATATAALVPWGDAVYDLEISDGSDVVKPFRGVAILVPETTT